MVELVAIVHKTPLYLLLCWSINKTDRQLAFLVCYFNIDTKRTHAAAFTCGFLNKTVGNDLK